MPDQCGIFVHRLAEVKSVPYSSLLDPIDEGSQVPTEGNTDRRHSESRKARLDSLYLVENIAGCLRVGGLQVDRIVVDNCNSRTFQGVPPLFLQETTQAFFC